MVEISFFDANCQLGRFNFHRPGAPFDLSALLADMEAQRIDRRLVYHAVAKEYNPGVGNGLVSGEIAPHDALYPCWAVTAWAGGEQPASAAQRAPSSGCSRLTTKPLRHRGA